MLEDIEILQYLQRTNPWWTTEKIPSSLLVTKFYRRDYYKIIERISDPFILSLTGLRRVGKTTLMRQLIKYLLEEKDVPCKNVLFLTFDDPFWSSSGVSFQKILDLYSETILGVPLEDLLEDNRVYFFIDEIQYFPEWERWLKVLYDRRYHLKFIISGSSSIHLHSKSAESLVGRIHIQKIFSLKFLEVCRLKYHLTGQKDESEDIMKFNRGFRRRIKHSVRTGRLNTIVEFLESEKLYWIHNKQQWLIYLNDYLVRGGFPELFQYNLVKSRQYIQTFTDLTLYRDIQQLFSIRNIEKFKQLFFWIVRESSQRTNTKNLAKTIGIKYETLQQYLQALETTFLIRKLPYYAKSTSKQIRWPIKYFVTDIGIQAAYLNYPLQLQEYDSQTLGKVVETLVCDHITQLKFNLEYGLTQPLYYWMDPNTHIEVDIICELFQRPIPIEVKYQNNIGKRDLKGIQAFLKKQDNSPFGLIVSKNTYEYKSDVNLLILPLWLFLMAL